MERQPGMILLLPHRLVPKLRLPPSLGDPGPLFMPVTVPSFTLNLFFDPLSFLHSVPNFQVYSTVVSTFGFLIVVKSVMLDW